MLKTSSSPHSSERSLELESLIAADPRNIHTNEKEEEDLLSNKTNGSLGSNGHVAEIVASPLKSTSNLPKTNVKQSSYHYFQTAGSYQQNGRFDS